MSTYEASANRYEVMKYNRCGKSGLMLPSVSLGLWHNFGTNDDFETMSMKSLVLRKKISRSSHIPAAMEMVPVQVKYMASGYWNRAM